MTNSITKIIFRSPSMLEYDLSVWASAGMQPVLHVGLELSINIDC